jgi:hypothetical protein
MQQMHRTKSILDYEEKIQYEYLINQAYKDSFYIQFVTNVPLPGHYTYKASANSTVTRLQS